MGADAGAANPPLVQACIDRVAADSAQCMEAWVQSIQTDLRLRQSEAPALEREVLHAAVHQLIKHKSALVQGFGARVLAAMEKAQQLPDKPMAASSVRFDQLQLMDDGQVQDNVELARWQQAALLSADSELAEFDARLSTAMGFASVRSEQNPLRPRVFAQALMDSLGGLKAEATVRGRWKAHAGPALGAALRPLYAGINRLLKERGADFAAYAVTPSAKGKSAAAAVGAVPSGYASQSSAQPNYSQQEAQDAQERAGFIDSVQVQDSDLTMAQLHQLLTADWENEAAGGQASALPPPPPAPAPSPVSDRAPFAPMDELHRYEETVPGALVALQDMQQLDHAVERLRSDPTPGRLSLGQRLGREVVHLMLANLTQDKGLLAPVRAEIAKLEPALLTLASTDPRFFTDQTHPARALLERIAQRSLAFASIEAEGFGQLMQSVTACVKQLDAAEIKDHAPFAQALEQLNHTWHTQDAAGEAVRQQAVQSLMRAEQRNLLAQKIVAQLKGSQSVGQAPAFVQAFLTGPWAQAMAAARVNPGVPAEQSKAYGDIVAQLVWSVQREQTSNNRQRLARLIPTILATLRQGLQGAGYAPEQTQVFFSQLMAAHEDGMRLQTVIRDKAPPVLDRAALEAQFAQPPENQGLWLADGEARDSGFMDEPELLPQAESVTARSAPSAPTDAARSAPAPAPGELALGAWVECLVQGQWTRAQLTWASPHGTLFMFTRANGQPYSLTRRSLDRLRETDALRPLAHTDVVADALDAVARTAMRNSVAVPKNRV